jgi:hypothetical protein
MTSIGIFEYGELSTVGVVGSTNGFVEELGDFKVLNLSKGTDERIVERPGGRDGTVNVTLVALLVGLDELPTTETEPEPAAGSGGFGNANDSEGEKGRTDMGVVACGSGLLLFRWWTIKYCEWSEPALPIEYRFSSKLLLLFPSRLMTRAGRDALVRPISAIAGGKGGIT